MAKVGRLMVMMLGISAMVGLATACTTSQTSTPTSAASSPTPAQITTALPAPTAFQVKCSRCHGLKGEGTNLAPGLARHSEELVRRQVRNPRGTMPAFTEAELSEADLQEIVRFIQSLSPLVTSEFTLNRSLLEHLQMMLLTLKTGDVDDAKEHAKHALAVVDEEARPLVEGIIDHLEAGRTHLAEHNTYDLLFRMSGAWRSVADFHLEMALSALDDNDLPDAIHHVAHFSQVVREEGNRIIVLLDQENVEEAHQAIEALLGKGKE